MGISQLEFLGYDIISCNGTGNVISGADDTTTLQPPENQMYELINLPTFINKVAAAGDGGTHQLEGYINSTTDGIKYRIFNIISAYNAEIYIYGYNHFYGDNTEAPSANLEQSQTIRGLCCNYSHPLKFKYSNDATTATQTNTRSIHACVKVYSEVI